MANRLHDSLYVWQEPDSVSGRKTERAGRVDYSTVRHGNPSSLV